MVWGYRPKRLPNSANNVANAPTSCPAPRWNSTRPDGVLRRNYPCKILIPRGGVRVEAQPVELSKVTGPDNSSPTGPISFSKINVLGEYLD